MLGPFAFSYSGGRNMFGSGGGTRGRWRLWLALWAWLVDVACEVECRRTKLLTHVSLPVVWLGGGSAFGFGFSSGMYSAGGWVTGWPDGWAERRNGGVQGSVLGCVVYKIPKLGLQVRYIHGVYGISAPEGQVFCVLNAWM